jgi:hypothetical protein
LCPADTTLQAEDFLTKSWNMCQKDATKNKEYVFHYAYCLATADYV